MTLKQAISILKQHNDWRKGAETPMIEPKELSMAIDLILKEVKKNESAQRDNETTPIIKQKSVESLGVSNEKIKLGNKQYAYLCSNCGRQISHQNLTCYCGFSFYTGK